MQGDDENALDLGDPGRGRLPTVGRAEGVYVTVDQDGRVVVPALHPPPAAVRSGGSRRSSARGTSIISGHDTTSPSSGGGTQHSISQSLSDTNTVCGCTTSHTSILDDVASSAAPEVCAPGTGATGDSAEPVPAERVATTLVPMCTSLLLPGRRSPRRTRTCNIRVQSAAVFRLT